MSDEAPPLPTLVGEDNPYGSDPDFALYPLPEHSAGGRLCSVIMGLRRKTYLDSFQRVNLCHTRRWGAAWARQAAKKLIASPSSLILLGAKVTRAAGFDFLPFEHVSAGVLCLPHPSGRCRLWNEPGAIDRARAALRDVTVDSVPYGEADAGRQFKEATRRFGVERRVREGDD